MDISPHGYRIHVEQVMGAMFWTYKVRHKDFGFSGAPDLQGMVYPTEVHTEDPAEVLSYIANEIGATLG